MKYGKTIVHERHEKHEMKTLQSALRHGYVPSGKRPIDLSCSCSFVSLVDNKGF